MILKAGDTAPKATATLMNGTTPVDLTGAAVLMRVKSVPTDRFVMSKTATIPSPTEGTVEYQWITGDIALLPAGAYFIEWVVTFAGGLIQRFPQPSNNELIVRPAAPAA